MCSTMLVASAAPNEGSKGGKMGMQRVIPPLSPLGAERVVFTDAFFFVVLPDFLKGAGEG
ncbi:MAG: hypothetical protein ACR2PG_25330 [Hyphomicrobiaceae bacterium]